MIWFASITHHHFKLVSRKMIMRNKAKSIFAIRQNVLGDDSNFESVNLYLLFNYINE